MVARDDGIVELSDYGMSSSSVDCMSMSGGVCRGAHLVCPLDEADGELRAERHDRTAPGLPCGRISKIVGLKIIAGIVQESLRALIVEVEASRAGQAEQRRDASVESADARHCLRQGGVLEAAKCQRDAQ